MVSSWCNILSRSCCGHSFVSGRGSGMLVGGGCGNRLLQPKNSNFVLTDRGCHKQPPIFMHFLLVPRLNKQKKIIAYNPSARKLHCLNQDLISSHKWIYYYLFKMFPRLLFPPSSQRWREAALSPSPGSQGSPQPSPEFSFSLGCPSSPWKR